MKMNHYNVIEHIMNSKVKDILPGKVHCQFVSRIPEKQFKVACVPSNIDQNVYDHICLILSHEASREMFKRALSTHEFYSSVVNELISSDSIRMKSGEARVNITKIYETVSSKLSNFMIDGVVYNHDNVVWAVTAVFVAVFKKIDILIDTLPISQITVLNERKVSFDSLMDMISFNKLKTEIVGLKLNIDSVSSPASFLRSFLIETLFNIGITFRSRLESVDMLLRVIKEHLKTSFSVIARMHFDVADSNITDTDRVRVQSLQSVEYIKSNLSLFKLMIEAANDQTLASKPITYETIKLVIDNVESGIRDCSLVETLHISTGQSFLGVEHFNYKGTFRLGTTLWVNEESRSPRSIAATSIAKFIGHDMLSEAVIIDGKVSTMLKPFLVNNHHTRLAISDTFQGTCLEDPNNPTVTIIYHERAEEFLEQIAASSGNLVVTRERDSFGYNYSMVVKLDASMLGNTRFSDGASLFSFSDYIIVSPLFYSLFLNENINPSTVKGDQVSVDLGKREWYRLSNIEANQTVTPIPLFKYDNIIFNYSLPLTSSMEHSDLSMDIHDIKTEIKRVNSSLKSKNLSVEERSELEFRRKTLENELAIIKDNSGHSVKATIQLHQITGVVDKDRLFVYGVNKENSNVWHVIHLYKMLKSQTNLISDDKFGHICRMSRLRLLYAVLVDDLIKNDLVKQLWYNALSQAGNDAIVRSLYPSGVWLEADVKFSSFLSVLTTILKHFYSIDKDLVDEMINDLRSVDLAESVYNTFSGVRNGE